MSHTASGALKDQPKPKPGRLYIEKPFPPLQSLTWPGFYWAFWEYKYCLLGIISILRRNITNFRQNHSDKSVRSAGSVETWIRTLTNVEQQKQIQKLILTAERGHDDKKKLKDRP